MNRNTSGNLENARHPCLYYWDPRGRKKTETLLLSNLNYLIATCSSSLCIWWQIIACTVLMEEISAWNISGVPSSFFIKTSKWSKIQLKLTSIELCSREYVGTTFFTLASNARKITCCNLRSIFGNFELLALNFKV